MQSSGQSDQSLVKPPSQCSPSNPTLLPSTSSPSSIPGNNSPDSGIAIGSQSFCSGESVSPPAPGPADSTSLFPPSSGPSLAPSPRKTATRGNSLPQLSSRINPALIAGHQTSSLTPPHNVMAPYNPAEMSGPYYPPRRSQQTHFPLNHTPGNYHSTLPPYTSYPPAYGGSGMSGQAYPPSYSSLPPYYGSGVAASSGYPNSASSLVTDSGYLAYPDPNQPAPTVAVSAMLPPPTAPADGGIFNVSYSTATTISSPCSSTHSDTIAATQIENTLNEFVASTVVTASPAASMSPTVNHHSPSLKTQQSMEVECLSTSDVGSGQENTEDEARDEQSMPERCVCVFSVFVDVHQSTCAVWWVLAVEKLLVWSSFQCPPTPFQCLQLFRNRLVCVCVCGTLPPHGRCRHKSAYRCTISCRLRFLVSCEVATKPCSHGLLILLHFRCTHTYLIPALSSDLCNPQFSCRHPHMLCQLFPGRLG